MNLENGKRWIRKEEYLLNYQHQHRGLNFIKLFLPQSLDKEVSLVGADGPIYRGRIPNISEDELPTEIDESSIDEEALYKNIRDMKFPKVPPQDPLGPIRRVDGYHTRKNKLFLAPVKVICEKNLEETELLGTDGGIYRGKEQIGAQNELDKQSSKKNSKDKDKQQNKIEPSIVTLQKAKKSMKRPKNIITIPIVNIRKTTEMVKSQKKDTDDTKQRTDKREDFNKKKKVTRIEVDTSDGKETESISNSEDSELRQNTEMEESEADNTGGNPTPKKRENLEETGEQNEKQEEDVEEGDEDNEDEEVDDDNEGGNEDKDDEGDEDKDDDEEDKDEEDDEEDEDDNEEDDNDKDEDNE